MAIELTFEKFDVSGAAGALWQNFSKVNLLLNCLYKMTMEPTFERFHVLAAVGAVRMWPSRAV